VKNQNGYGIIDLRLKYEGSDSAWATGNHNQTSTATSCAPAGKKVIGMQVREQHPYGIIDLAALYQSTRSRSRSRSTRRDEGSEEAMAAKKLLPRLPGPLFGDLDWTSGRLVPIVMLEGFVDEALVKALHTEVMAWFPDKCQGKSLRLGHNVHAIDLHQASQGIHPHPALDGEATPLLAAFAKAFREKNEDIFGRISSRLGQLETEFSRFISDSIKQNSRSITIGGRLSLVEHTMDTLPSSIWD